MQKEIRSPIQQRSIETKRKIVLSGFFLFAQNGFFKTNTAQIARNAGVSTGIVYGYFKNKKDILKEVIDEYIFQVYTPFFTLFEGLKEKKDIESFAFEILSLAEKIYKKNRDIHNELTSVSQVDCEIKEIFLKLEDEMTLKFFNALRELHYQNVSLENVHLSMNLIENYVHEELDDKHEYINYDNLKTCVVKLIKTLFE